MNGIQARLQGSWAVVSRLSAGVDDRDPDDDVKYLWFQEDIVVTGDDWAAWDMPYVVRGEANRGEFDVTREDLNNPWLQLGILEIEDNTLRLCLAGDPDHPRPRTFSSTEDNDCVLYVLERCDKPVPE